MIPSQLKKDRPVSVRVNSLIKIQLESMGWTVQQLLDWAVNLKAKVTKEIEAESRKKKVK